MLANRRYHVTLGRLDSNADGVLHGQRVRAAMGDDHHAIHAQERPPPYSR